MKIETDWKQGVYVLIVLGFLVAGFLVVSR